jgi:hypothetical protein
MPLRTGPVQLAGRPTARNNDTYNETSPPPAVRTYEDRDGFERLFLSCRVKLDAPEQAHPVLYRVSPGERQTRKVNKHLQK